MCNNPLKFNMYGSSCYDSVAFCGFGGSGALNGTGLSNYELLGLFNQNNTSNFHYPRVNNNGYCARNAIVGNIVGMLFNTFTSIGTVALIDWINNGGGSSKVKSSNTTTTTTPSSVETPNPQPAETKAKAETETKSAETDNSVKDNSENETFKAKTEAEITEKLKDKKIDYEGVNIKDITKKYNTLGELFGEDAADTRIENYIKGVQFHNFVAKAVRGDNSATYEIPGAKEAMQEGNQSKYNRSIQSLGASYVELYDEDCDGYIDAKDLIKLEEKETGKRPIADVLSNRIGMLDKSGDNKIDANEATAYIYALSKVNDTDNNRTGNDITAQEWQDANLGFAIMDRIHIVSSEKDKNGEFDATKEEYDKMCKAIGVIANKHLNLDDLLINDTDINTLNLDSTSKQYLTDGLELLGEYGFDQDMISKYLKAMGAFNVGYDNLKTN